jgi:transcriptional regulator with XRE-family HTH domain
LARDKLQSDKACELGKRIRELRRKKGWTQEDLVFLTRLNQKTIKDIERGRRAARAHSLTAIANALGVTVEALTEIPPVEILPAKSLSATAGKGEPMLLPECRTTFGVPRLDDSLGPSVSVSMAVASGISSRQYFAEQLGRDIENLLIQWRWCELKRSGQARYSISCSTIRTGERLSVFVAIDNVEWKHYSSFHYPIGANNDVNWKTALDTLSLEIFRWIKGTIFRSEESLGVRASWTSPNASQCALWAYLCWSRSTQIDNQRARKLALHAATLDPGKSRAWSIYGQTFIEGRHYGWDADLAPGARELARASGHAQAADPLDTFSRTLNAHLFMSTGNARQALRHLESAVDGDRTTSLARNFYGLICLYAGDFRSAERVLQPLVDDDDHDIVRAVGLQYLGQCKTFLGRCDEGVSAAQQAININSRAVPAMRTLAISLVSCGLEDEGRMVFRQAEMISPGFTTDAYRKQPWLPAAHDAVRKWVSNAEKAMMPRE